MSPSPSPTPRQPLQIGEFLADPGLNVVVGPQGPVALEPKILEVLLCLAARPGETVAPEELLATVWEGKFVVDAVVTRAISELRRAFGDDPKAPRILGTSHGEGYVFTAPLA